MTRTTTKKTRRTHKTPEQRAAEAQALHDTLTAQVEALTDSDTWKRFLQFTGSFHAYSLSNVLLILAQMPEATAVAGFRQWQAKGRQVRKGERAIKIRGYSSKKITTDAGKDRSPGAEDQADPVDTSAGDQAEGAARVLRRFPILSVFDISQTDPIDGPDGEPDVVENLARRLTGDDPTAIYDQVAAHMTGLGWTVVREAIPGESNGYTTTDGSRRIVVEEHMSPAQAAKTMIHEAAHATLHAEPGQEVSAGEYVAHRGLYECEAESVAYVLAGMVGLDTSAYSVGYVTQWTGGDVEVLRSTAANVLRAVDALAPALIDEPAERDEDAA